jgi:hypothetical protein
MTGDEDEDDFIGDDDVEFSDGSDGDPFDPPKYTAADWLRLIGEIGNLSGKDADAIFEMVRERLDDSVPF